MDADPILPAQVRRTRLLLADDQRLVRAALRATLEECADLEVVAEAGDADQCLRLCAATVPDVVLVDLALPGRDGVHVTRVLAERLPSVQVMFLGAAVDGERVRRALDAGAVGYLLKDADPSALREGVRAVARGESPLDPRAVRAMLRARPGARGADLTAREREVLALVVRGLPNKQIARELQITDGTVKAHIGSIFTRIGVADRTSAALWAERNMDPDDLVRATGGRAGDLRRGEGTAAARGAGDGDRRAPVARPGAAGGGVPWGPPAAARWEPVTA